MNEHIDILLTSAKVVSRNNPWAHLTTQAISMGYNASMLWHYNYQLGMAPVMGSSYMPAEQIQAMKQDRIKHTALLFAESLGLIVAGICSLQEQSTKG